MMAMMAPTLMKYLGDRWASGFPLLNERLVCMYVFCMGE